MSTLSNVETRRGETNPLDIRVTPDTIPEAKSSKTGVSVRYAYDPAKKWFVFRASYGRENKAADYLIEDGTYIYIAKKYVEKYVGGKRKIHLQTLIPNLLFVYTTEEKAEEYICHTPEISFLTYYYDHFKLNDNKKNPPLTISCYEMDEFIKATCNRNKHIMFVNPSQCHYKGGEKVRVTEGLFKGVEGRVARVAGQQRVIVSLSQIGIVSTAYIPTAFLQVIDN